MSQDRDLEFSRRILLRMGETGQPPERGAMRVNVGTTELLETLRREYLVTIRQSGRNSAFKLVQAPFGGGKSQFLHCLRELAWKEGFVTALVDVSPQECPFDDPVRVYQAVATRLEAPPADLAEEAEIGMDALLRREIRRRKQQDGVEATRTWLDEKFGSARVDSLAVRRAALLLMRATLDRDEVLDALLTSWLRGEQVSPGEVREHGIREQLEAGTAFRFLRSLVQVVRALELPGVVLLFDELDRVMSLTGRRRRSIGDTLRAMIDHCGQATLPSLLWVYAVPPEFLTTVVPEYPALEQRLRGAAHFSQSNPLAPVIDLDRLPVKPGELLQQIGARLLELHVAVHGDKLRTADARGAVEALAKELGARQLEIGTRRTFVKSCVQLLAELERSEPRRMDAAAIRGWLQSGGGTPAAAAVLPGEKPVL